MLQGALAIAAPGNQLGKGLLAHNPLLKPSPPALPANARVPARKESATAGASKALMVAPCTLFYDG